jgi:hypothetical protein
MPRKHKPAPAGHPALTPAAPLPALSGRAFDWLTVGVLFAVPLLFYGKFLFGPKMMFGTDLLAAGSYMLREWMKVYIAQHGWIAYWLPHILCGQPTGAAFYADLFYPTLLLRSFLPVHIVWAWTFQLHVFIAGLGTWLFLRELKVERIPAALGGLAYALAGSLLTLSYAGHDGRLIGSALAPLALLFLHRGMTRQRFVWFAAMGLVLALQLLSGHIQKVYYTGMLLVAWFVFTAFRAGEPGRRGRTALKLGLWFLIGLGLSFAISAVQYLPIVANMPFASRGGERGYEYATSWSMPVIETFDLVTPKFSGGLGAYWGKNPFKLHSEYLGILPLLFAFIAVLGRWRDKYVRFFTFSFIGTLLMAWGGNTPFYYIPYYLFPGVTKFRGPAMIFFVGALSLCVLAGFGIDHLLREFKAPARARALRAILVGGAIPLALLALFGGLRDSMLSFLKSATVAAPQKVAALSANYPNLVSGLLFAAVIGVAGALLAWLLLSRRLKPAVFAAIAAAVMVLDIGLALGLWDESRGYIRSAPPPAQYFADDEVTSFLKTDTSLYRVLPLHYERSDEGILALHDIQSTGGQIPNPLQSYQDFIGAGTSVMFAAGNLMLPAAMNLANVKYVISVALPDDASRYSQNDQQAIAQIKAYFAQPQFALARLGQKYAVWENRAALPRAFVSSYYEIVKDKEEVIARLSAPGFDPRGSVLLYDNPGFEQLIDVLGRAPQATITGYDPNRIVVRTETSRPGLLVLSENWHPDYRAWLDGKPVKVLRAFHTFRAVPVPAGDHEVVFRYVSPSYRLGGYATLAGLLVFAGAVVLASLRRRRETRAHPTPTA